MPISAPALAAARYLVHCSEKRLFSFELSEQACKELSGITETYLITQLERSFSTTTILISIGVTALISGLTIGGKALFKRVAIEESTAVVYRVARIMNALHLFR